MSTWYRTTSYSIEIEPVEIERETENCVWYIGTYWGKPTVRRTAKASGHCAYHRSWADANAHLLERARNYLQIAKDSVEDAEIEVKTLETRKEPKP